MPEDPDRQQSTATGRVEAARTSDTETEPGAPHPGRQPAPPTPGRTRTSTTFNSLVAGVVVLILLLVFILENTESVPISYFGATGHISLGLALLIAAAGGALLVGLAGAARVPQLRHRMTRNR